MLTDFENELQSWGEQKGIVRKKESDSSSSNNTDFEKLFEEDEKEFQNKQKLKEGIEIKEDIILDKEEQEILQQLKENKQGDIILDKEEQEILQQLKENKQEDIVLDEEEEKLLQQLKENKQEDKELYDRNEYVNKICKMTKKQPLEYLNWSDDEIKQRYSDIFMYETKIIIGNPKEMPFGCLSNNFTHYMVIDDKYWSTVSNYVYSNMLFTPIYRLVLQNTPTRDFKIKKFTQAQIEEKTNKYVINLQNQQRRLLSSYEIDKIKKDIEYEYMLANMDITNLYLHYKEEEYRNNTIRAVNKAYSTLIENNSYLQDELLKTGNSVIVYKSNNKILGSEGDNAIGIILMQLRHIISDRRKVQEREEREKEESETIIKMFYVYKILSLLNPTELESLKDKSIDEIYEYGENKDLIVILKDPNPILQSYKRGLYPEIERMIKNQNNIIVSFLESKKVKANPDLTKTIIFQTFTKYIISKNFPNMSEKDKQIVISQLLHINHDNISADEMYKNMENKVYDLYITNRLPKDLLSLIQAQLPKEEKVEIKEEKKNKEDKEESDEESDELNKLIPSAKSELIKRLSKHTGKSEKHYRKKSIDDIRERLKKYEDIQENKIEGYAVFIKLKNLKKELLGEIKEKDKKEIEKMLKKYNIQNDTSYSMINVFVQPIKKENEEKIEIFNIKEEKELDIITYDKDSLFSPLKQYDLIIDDLEFPNISSYITCCNMCLMYVKKDRMGLLTQRTMRDAYELLKPYFNDPVSAKQFYDQSLTNSEDNAFRFFTKRAIANKFRDVNLRNVLFLSGNKKLVMKYIQPDIAKISCNAMMKIRNTIVPDTLNYDYNNFTQFLERDVFISAWIDMRTEDICATLVRFYKFLNIKIDMNIANIIMDNIYKSCASISTLNMSIPPKSFTSLVLYNLSEFIESSSIMEEIEALEKQMRDMDDFFYGIRSQTIPEAKMTINSYNRKLVYEFEKFKEQNKNDPELIEQEQRRFNRKLEKFIQGNTENKLTFEQKQRQEWIEFLNEINEPELSKEEILEQYNNYCKKLAKKNDIKKLEKKYSGEDLDNAKDALKKEINKATAEKLKILSQPKLSDAERNKRTLEFRKKQEEERIAYYGVNMNKKTKEEIQKHNQSLEIIKHNINELYAKRKQENTAIISAINNIASMIWTKLISILTNETQDIAKIKASIIDAENKLNNNLLCENPKECVIKALLNVIIGIYSTKQKLNIEDKFSTVDIDLACSIILNNRFEKEDNESVFDEEKYFEEVKELEQEFEEEEEKSDIELEFEEPNETEESDKAEFGMIYKESEVAVNLETITGEGISVDLVNYFMDTVKIILKRKNKINRINFFSVL